MADLSFSVKGYAVNPTRLDVKTRDFSITVDEPPALGGTDIGANPVEYLLAAYGGCINVVAHLTAKEIGLRLDGLEIQLSGDINPARLFGQPTDDRAGFKSIEIEFRPKTNASELEIENWISIIKARCPINDNLANATPINLNWRYKNELLNTNKQ